ncbi:MAG TPA: hypothetical protein PLJ35_21650 [Anaerolineae bacterium]|nr:hypothetical protein [Anaerolineae bacterium]HOR01426.1 hypothetical protein [Anaerolineae bacterium]HPL29435.1 hypothetical protein [Anaerolineae bacterium]
MAIEYVEYRPGKWVKVVDGRIIGRATPAEVAAWQAGGRARDEMTGAGLDLDLDVDLAPGVQASPARAIDVSLRPAFERRRRPAATPGPPASGEAGAPTTSHSALSGPPAAVEKASKPPAASPGRATSGEVKPPAAKPPAAAAGAPVTPGAAPKAAGEEAKGTGASPPSPEAAAPAKPPRAARPRRRTPDAAPPEPEAAGQAEERQPGFWWIWNAHGQPVEAFLREWAPKYRARFGHEVSVVVCHESDLAAAEACGYHAEASPLLQPGHFYLGHSTE